MPRDAASTRSELASRAVSPIRAAAGTGVVVHVDLRFAGAKQFLPEDLFDALVAKYGAGKVTTDRDTQAGRQGSLQFVISP
jgi:hypothetical protein